MDALNGTANFKTTKIPLVLLQIFIFENVHLCIREMKKNENFRKPFSLI